MFNKTYRYLKLADKAPDKPISATVTTRLMHPSDFDEVCVMLRKFRNYHPIREIREIDDERHVRALLNGAVNGRGLALVAENNTGLLGLIFGMIAGSLWSPSVICMHEFAFYVNENARFKRVGYLLLKDYLAGCKLLKEKGKIHVYSMGEIPESPDYSRFGMIPCERVWMA
jgi:hypothetical protein